MTTTATIERCVLCSERIYRNDGTEVIHGELTMLDSETTHPMSWHVSCLGHKKFTELGCTCRDADIDVTTTASGDWRIHRDHEDGCPLT